MPRSPLVLIIVLSALALVAPGPALAGFVPPEVIDGPSPDIVRVGGVDLARDGNGAVVYVKRDTGVEHVFVSRLAGGVWQPPERLDPGLVTPSGEPVVAVSGGGRMVAAFTNAGQLYTVFRPVGATSWGAPVPLASPAATPVIDMSTNGVTYVAWAANGDVRAARMDRLESAFTTLAGPLDIDPAADAGSGTGRPAITAPADGTAMVVWGEQGHVYARRLLGLQQSQFPQDATVTSYNGHTGGNADLPAVDQPDDSSFAWVVFRQAFDGNATTRAMARRWAGATFDPPIDIGGGGFGGEATDSPAVDANGATDVAMVSETTATHSPFGEFFYADQLKPSFPIGPSSAVPTQPRVAIGESSTTVMAWLRADTAGGPVSVHARTFKKTAPVEPEATVSDPTLGTVDTAAGFFAGADKAGDTAMPYIQVNGTDRRLVASLWDRPPSSMVLLISSRWHNWPTIGWVPASEYWGAVSYRVVVDGRTIGTFAKPHFSPRGLIADGEHRLSVVATDIRGQSLASLTRTLRIDTRPPRATLNILGTRSAGSTLTFVTRATDPGKATTSSRVDLVSVDFGDGTSAVGRKVHHVFRAGTWMVNAVARDGAGNRTTITRSVTVR